MELNTEIESESLSKVVSETESLSKAISKTESSSKAISETKSLSEILSEITVEWSESSSKAISEMTVEWVSEAELFSKTFSEDSYYYSDAILDPDTENFNNPKNAWEYYEALCVNPYDWVIDHFHHHRLVINPGEDLAVKIATFSRWLGEHRSVSVRTAFGSFQSMNLVNPNVTIEGVETWIIDLSGAFENGSLVSDLCVTLACNVKNTKGGGMVDRCFPLIASEPVKLLLVSYRKRPRRILFERGYDMKLNTEIESESDMELKAPSSVYY